MKTTNQKIGMSLLFGIAAALALLAPRGAPAASADASDLKIEETCSPHVFRPNEWTLHECLIHLTNVGDTPLSNLSSVWASSSGVNPDYYFVLYEVDGQPRPINPTGLSFGTSGTLQPGQSSDVRLDVLLRMPSEGIYDGEWHVEADGNVVAESPPVHYEAKADAADPPTDLAVSQVGYRKSTTTTVFDTTITNNSASAVTQLSVTEHYGPSLKPAGTQFTPSESLPDANLMKWDLASLGVQSLAPGESLKLSTTYTTDDPSSPVQSGVMVEATVGGKQQLYGSSGVAPAYVPQLKIEETCTPYVFRPNEWTLHECLIQLTNVGDTPLSNLSGDYASSSGVIPDHYFILYEVDGRPRPIDPTGLSFGNSDTLQPGQTSNVRLDVLLRMPSEGIYDGEWPVEVDGVIVPGSLPDHYEAKVGAADPPTDLAVSQVGYLKGTRTAVFDTTITNNSASAVTQLSVMEHYGASAKPAGTKFNPSESVPSANLMKWDLASLGKQSLAPGESLRLSTVYMTDSSAGPVESGVLVEATVDGKQQLYGSSGGSVCVACDQEPAAAPATGLNSVSAPRTGDGPSGNSVPLTLDVALAAAGVALGSVALVARRKVRR